MVKSPDKWVSKYERRATVATEDYRDGVMNPSRDPIQAAISMRKTLEAKMARKETWDKWEAGLKYVGFEGWQKMALEKGVDRYAPGVRASLDKYADFASKFAEHLRKGVEEVHKMPKVTIDDSIKRAEYMIRHNAQFRYKKS